MNNFISKEKDYIKEYNKNYYAKTKYEKGLRQIQCEICDKNILLCSLSRHIASKKCQIIKQQKLNPQVNT